VNKWQNSPASANTNGTFIKAGIAADASQLLFKDQHNQQAIALAERTSPLLQIEQAPTQPSRAFPFRTFSTAIFR
jgi:hypothetical protein